MILPEVSPWLVMVMIELITDFVAPRQPVVMTLLPIFDSLRPVVWQLTGALGKPRTIPYAWSLTHAGTLGNSRPFTNARSVCDPRSIANTRSITDTRPIADTGTISGARRQRAWASAAIAEKLCGRSTNNSTGDGTAEV